MKADFFVYESIPSTPQAAFIAHKGKAKQVTPKFSSENKGFAPATVATTSASDMDTKLTLGASLTAKPPLQFVRTEDELKEPLTKFKTVPDLH